MRFEVGDFRVYTKKEVEELYETYLKPVINPDFNSQYIKKTDKYIETNKRREFTVFDRLKLLETEDNKYYTVIADLFDFIDLIEILKAFAANKLDTEKIYNINNKFTAKVAQKDKKTSLSLHFENYSYKLYLDKFECSSLAAKFSKILSRCEAWEEHQQ